MKTNDFTARAHHVVWVIFKWRSI